MSYIQKSTASNIDLEVIEETVLDMVTKKIIDKDFRVLNESCNPFSLSQISVENVEKVKTLFRKRKQNSSKISSLINRQFRNYTFSFFTSYTKPIKFFAKFNTIEANLMAIKSFYIYEVCELRNEASSLKSILNNLISNLTEIDNQITTETLNNNNILETKIVFFRKGTVISTIRNTE